MNFEVEESYNGYSVSAKSIRHDGNVIRLTLKKSKEDNENFFISYDSNKYYIVNSSKDSIKVNITIIGEFDYSTYSLNKVIELKGCENPIHKSEVLTNYDLSQLDDFKYFDNLPLCLNNNLFNPSRIQFQKRPESIKYLHDIGFMYGNDYDNVKYYPSSISGGGVDFPINNYIQKINAFFLSNLIYLQTITDDGFKMQNILYDRINKSLSVGSDNKVIAFYS